MPKTTHPYGQRQGNAFGELIAEREYEETICFTILLRFFVFCQAKPHSPKQAT